MIGKNNIKKQNERRGEKIETYSIKKFKVGAASVLIGVGLFFGAGVVEAKGRYFWTRVQIPPSPFFYRSVPFRYAFYFLNFL